MNKISLIKNCIIVLVTALISIGCTLGIGAIVYHSKKPTLTIVFYATDIEEVQDAINHKEEYVVAYYRLNSDNNHTLNVSDFKIFNNTEYQRALKVEYFEQTITTQFYTYPNQPTLKVYFKVPHTVNNDVVFTKYKDTIMRIGEFAQTR